jgi:hypothetical protein
MGNEGIQGAEMSTRRRTVFVLDGYVFFGQKLTSIIKDEYRRQGITVPAKITKKELVDSFNMIGKSHRTAHLLEMREPRRTRTSRSKFKTILHEKMGPMGQRSRTPRMRFTSTPIAATAVRRRTAPNFRQDMQVRLGTAAPTVGSGGVGPTFTFQPPDWLRAAQRQLDLSRPQPVAPVNNAVLQGLQADIQQVPSVAVDEAPDDIFWPDPPDEEFEL